jgi:hypothetical protein
LQKETNKFSSAKGHHLYFIHYVSLCVTAAPSNPASDSVADASTMSLGGKPALRANVALDPLSLQSSFKSTNTSIRCIATLKDFYFATAP